MGDLSKLLQGIEAYGLPCTDGQAEQFSLFYQLLVERNRVMNLTAITEWEDVVEKHFLDSLALFSVSGKDMLSGKRVLDLGTGAGFPGIPLAIMEKNAHFVLTDSLQKRIGFLEDVIKTLSLTNVETVHARAEDLGHESNYREAFDLVVSRAVANLSTLSEYCLPFVKLGGYFFSYKSGEVEEEVTEATKAISVLGGDNSKIHYLTVPGTELSRSILQIPKKKASPGAYPRKAGTPGKKPLR